VGRDGREGIAGDAAPPAPSEAPPAPTPPPDGRTTRETDLGALGTEVADQPPPEDWPSSPILSGVRSGAAAAQRDAFLAGWLVERAGLGPEAGTVVVRDGRLSATLGTAGHEALDAQVAALQKDEARIYGIEVRATELPKDRATALLAAVGVERSAATPGSGPGDAGGPFRALRVGAEAAARLEERLHVPGGPATLHGLDARLAARHTQLVTAQQVRSRAIVSDFRVVRRPDGGTRLDPVNGTVEEGIVVAVRPVAYVGGLTWLYVTATLARVDREEPWALPAGPAEAPPKVVLPHHAESRLGGHGVIDERESLLLVADAPGTDGARVVLIRVRHLRP
jgi:hypothetical protein